MNRKVLFAILATILCLSVAMLAACGCQHFYEGGICINCGQADPDYAPAPCNHYYVNGACKDCGEVDPNFNAGNSCSHYYENGACVHCGDLDANYVPPVEGGDDVVTVTSVNKAVSYGKDGDTYTLSGVVYQTASNGYYINDGTASIFVNDATTVALGDQVVVTGTIAFATNWKMPSFTATTSEVKSSGNAAVQVQEVEIANLYGETVLPSSFYGYVKLSGMVELVGETYKVTYNGSSVVVSAAAVAQFQSLVGKSVEFEAILTAFSTLGWKITPVGTIEQKVPNLAEVADSIFDWVATQLPEGVYSSLVLPTAYELQPGVEFNWTVQTGTALSIENNLVTINSVTQDETVVVLLTLTAGNHAPQTKTYEVVVKYSLMSIGEILSSEHGAQIKIQGVIGGFAAQTVTTYNKPQNGLVLTDGTGVLVIDDLGVNYRDGAWVNDKNEEVEDPATAATRNGEYVVDGHKLAIGDKVEIVGTYTNIPMTETNFGQRKVVVTSIKYLSSGNEVAWKGPDVVVSNEAEAVAFAKNWYVGMVVKLVATTENPLCIRCSGSATAGKTTWSLHYKADNSTVTLANLRYTCADGTARAIGLKGESSEYALGTAWWSTLGLDYKNDKTLNKKQFTGDVTLVITAYGSTNIQTTAISMNLTAK